MGKLESVSGEGIEAVVKYELATTLDYVNNAAFNYGRAKEIAKQYRGVKRESFVAKWYAEYMYALGRVDGANRMAKAFDFPREIRKYGECDITFDYGIRSYYGSADTFKIFDK